MKKIVTLVAITFLGMVVFPSCKKDYTCTCTINGQSYPYSYKSVKKKEAKASCDQQGVAAALLGGNCKLD